MFLMMAAEESHRITSSAEAELLMLCARLDINSVRAERISALLGQELDWTRMLALAQRNALVPLLYYHLNRIAPAKVPPERLRELRERFQNNSALNVLLTGEMVSLLELFEQNQIPAVPYKGPAISVGIYGKLSLRQFADLDILVPEKDVWKATELLINRGYQAHFVIPERKQASFIRLSYVRLFKRDSDNTTVELHWRLAPRFFGVSFDTSTLWQRTRMIPLQGANVRIPLSVDLVMMLCIHGAKDCWERLEWVSGLAELIRSDAGIDWHELLERAKEAHCLAIVSMGLLLAHDLLDAPIPAEVIAKLETPPDSLTSQIVSRFFSDENIPLTLGQRIRFHLQTKDSVREKARYCLRLALTTTPVDWEMMSLPESASFLYFPLRVIRLIKKYGWESDQLAARSESVGPV
jgi:Uncharacterised nucleotidyltransferase